MDALTEPPSPARREPTAHNALTALDDALLDVQRIVRRPGYRARLLAALRVTVEISTVRVLRAVERSGDRAPCIGDIAERLTIDPSTASRLVDQQVDAGFLLRHRDPDDGRRSRLGLTVEGRELLDQVTDARRRILAEATSSWDPSDLQRLSELLVHLREDFDQLEAGT